MAGAENLSHLAPVFEAIQDGTITSRVGEFSDEQLKPFLPSLFAASFAAFKEDHCNKPLLGRVVSFGGANRLEILRAIPYESIEQEAIQNRNRSSAFDVLNFENSDEEKLREVAAKLLERTLEDDFTGDELPFIVEEQTAEASLLLSMLSLSCPSLVTPSTLASFAVTHAGAPRVVVNAIVNTPELIFPVLGLLCDRKTRSEETPRGRNRASTIEMLLSLSPRTSDFVFGLLFSNKADCLLAMRLAMQYLDDSTLMSYLSAELLNRSRPFSTLLHRSPARPIVAALYQKLVRTVDMVVQEKTPSVDACTLLLSYCTLHTSSSYKPTPDDTEKLVAFITATQSLRVPDAYYIMAVAVVVTQPSLTVNATHYGILKSWLSGMRIACEQDLSLPPASRSHNSLAHALLFVGTCIIREKTEQLVPFLAGAIRMKVSLPNRHLSTIRHLFDQAGFTERELATMCSRLPITSSLTVGHSDSSIPAFSVNELLATNSFQRHGVPIADWLERQTAACSTPLHPIMASLLDRLAIAAVSDNILGLSTLFIQESFVGALSSDAMLTRRILATLFLLSYRLHLEAARVNDKATPRLQLYDDSFYSHIPLRYLLGVVEVQHSAFSHIRAWFIRLASELYPYMLPSTSSVQIARTSLAEPDRTLDKEKLEKQLSSGHVQALAAMRKIEAAPLSEQADPAVLAMVSRAVALALEPGCNMALVEVSTRIWKRLERVVPRLLIEKSSTEWLRGGGCHDIPSLSKIYDMPPLLFRVDRRFFTSPPHFSCFIKSLFFFMQAGRAATAKALLATSEREDFTKQERDLVGSTADHTQTAAIVHLLVEIIDPRRFPKDLSPARIDELHFLACEQLHQMFIADRQLLKLVLWQLLPLHMLPSLVESIPSLHVSLEFVHEMLSNNETARRVFAVALAAQLSSKYRILASARTMEMVLDVVATVVKIAPTATHLALMVEIIPWMQQTCTVFPQLAGEITVILMAIRSIAKTRLALNPVVISTKKKREERMIDEIDEALTAAVNSIVV